MSLYWCLTFKFRIYKFPELAKVEVKGTILRLLNLPKTSDTSYKTEVSRATLTSDQLAINSEFQWNPSGLIIHWNNHRTHKTALLMITALLQKNIQIRIGQRKRHFGRNLGLGFPNSELPCPQWHIAPQHQCMAAHTCSITNSGSSPELLFPVFLLGFIV